MNMCRVKWKRIEVRGGKRYWIRWRGRRVRVRLKWKGDGGKM